MNKYDTIEEEKFKNIYRDVASRTNYGKREIEVEGLILFDGKREYCEFVVLWKTKWNLIVDEIKKAKRENEQSLRNSLRKKARTYLLMRREGKRLARIEYQKRVDLKIAAA